MTPVRAKRFSKVPNRFSSDNSRSETSNANGEIIDFDDKSAPTTHNHVPVSKTIKLKPVMREPLKVKLPKLKRPSHHNSAKERETLPTVESSEIRLHKIKLPSLSKRSKNLTSSTNKRDLSNYCKDSSQDTHSSIIPVSTKIKSTNHQMPTILDHSMTLNSSSNFVNPSCSPSNSSMSSNAISAKTLSVQPETTTAVADLDTSNASSVTSEDHKQSFNNVSSSSHEGDSSGMKIVVSSLAGEQSSGSGIRCPCGVENDLGVMVECENCSTWQHGHCINIGSEDDAYEGYICAFCTLPSDRVIESLQHLTVNDKFGQKFTLLESLVKNERHQGDRELSDIKPPEFTQEELAQALRELRRVLGSLKVKMAMLISKDYDTELQIWKNPNWSDKPLGNRAPYIYIWDNYKFNLQMNVHNMMRKMKTRSRLIEFALSQIEKEDVRISDTGIDTLRLQNMEILENVRELESKYHDYSLTSRSSDVCDLPRPQSG